MRADQALERLGGVATTETLLRATTRGRLRVALQRRTVIRNGRGAYALPGVDEALRAAQRLHGVLVEDSAAAFHGWELLRRPGEPCVAVPRKRALPPERRAGARVRYLDLEPGDVSGLAATPGATVMQCAARLPFADALSVADSARRHLDVGPVELLRRAGSMSPRYRSRCLRVAEHADGRAANPFESALRSYALDAGLDVEPQVWVDGVGRPDLVDRGRRLILEADSFEFHGRRAALTRDCERYNAFVRGGWTVLRFAWEHVVLQPDYVRDQLGAAAGRPHAQALGALVRAQSA